MLNLDQLDPDWELAKIHGKASKLGIPAVSEEEQEQKHETLVCKCCFQPLIKNPIPFCENSKQLQFLGFGYPLFYIFIKNCIMMLVLSLCVYGAYALRRAVKLNRKFCSQSASYDNDKAFCSSWMIRAALLKFDNYDDEFDEGVMRVLSFLVHLLFLMYMRDNLIKLEAYYDQKTTSLSDFTVMIKNFPKVLKTQEKLKRFFNSGFKKRHIIKKMILIPKYKEIEKLEKENQELIGELKKIYQSNDYSEGMEEERTTHQALKEKQRKIIVEIERNIAAYARDEVVAERIILSFNTEQEKDEIVEEVSGFTQEKLKDYFTDNCKHFSLKEAPEPMEIIWENIGLERKEKLYSRVSGWGLSFIVLVVFALFVLGILIAKNKRIEEALEKLAKNPEDEEALTGYREAEGAVYVILFVIIIFNKFIMAPLFYKFTEIEKHNSNSKFQFSFALKFAFGLFFTIGLMGLMVEGAKFQRPYGIIEHSSILFFINGLFVPFFWLINPSYIKKNIQRRLYIGKKHFTQGEANKLMEDPEYDMGIRYAEIITTLWFTFFYISLVPFGVVVSTFSVILYYWIDKYNLLRRSRVSKELSGKLIFTSLTLVDFSLILRTAGEVIFDINLRGQRMGVSVLLLILSILYFLLPKKWLFDLVHPEKFRPESKTYEQVKESFQHTYTENHPIFKKIRSRKNAEKVKKLGYIFENPEYDQQKRDRMNQIEAQNQMPLESCKQLQTETHLHE